MSARYFIIIIIIIIIIIQLLKLDQGLTSGHVKWTLATPHISKVEISAFSLYLTAAVFEKYSKKTFLMDK